MELAMRIFTLGFFALLTLSGTAAMAVDAPAQGGWYQVGTFNTPYVIGAGPVAGMTAHQAVYIRKIKGSDDPHARGRLERTIPLAAWRGQRLRLSLRLKAEDGARLFTFAEISKANGAGIRTQAESNSFGNAAWQTHVFVLDVPDNATALVLQVDLNGDGAGWVDEVTLGAVGGNVALSPASLVLPAGQMTCGLSGIGIGVGTGGFNDCSRADPAPPLPPPALN
jgi:hypothetical protein